MLLLEKNMDDILSEDEQDQKLVNDVMEMCIAALGPHVYSIKSVCQLKHKILILKLAIRRLG